MTINLFGRDAIMAAGDEELDEDASQLNIPIQAFDLTWGKRLRNWKWP